MKTLIIGAKGMLGYELAKAFISDKPFLWDLDEIDITDREQVDEKIGSLAPELIINVAAYTNVDACEENEELATRVNGEAVGYLAHAAQTLGAAFVHYSTDYVFDGTQKEGYMENGKPQPINAYGRSKLAGEERIQSSGLKNWYIIRTAWLYGANGKNFVETMLSLQEKNSPIAVVDDQVGSPTYAPDLAQATRDIVESKKPFGIYHRTNDNTTSWYKFAKEIFQVFNKDADLKACATADYPRPAARPAFSVLRSTKLPALRPWQEALRAYADERTV